MPPTPFGEHLKRERELRGVSLDEVAAATRISTRFLEALENGDWGELPGGAFNRGFIRATARFLGLNEDEMVAEYALETKEQNDSRAAVAANEAIPRDLRPLGFAIAVVVVLLALIAYGFHRLRLAHLRKRQAAAIALAAGVNPATSTGTDVNAATGKAAVTSLPPEKTSNASAPSAPAFPAKAPARTDAATPAGVPSLPSVLELKLLDEKSARVTVEVDGRKVFEGRIKSKPKIFHGRDRFEITSSEVSSLTVDLDGKRISVREATAGHPFFVSRNNLQAAAPPAKP